MNRRRVGDQETHKIEAALKLQYKCLDLEHL